MSYKAFAQSDVGSWGWKSSRTSKEHAVRSALISCQKNNNEYEEKHPCKIINIDDVWIYEW